MKAFNRTDIISTPRHALGRGVRAMLIHLSRLRMPDR